MDRIRSWSERSARGLFPFALDHSFSRPRLTNVHPLWFAVRSVQSHDTLRRTRMRTVGLVVTAALAGVVLLALLLPGRPEELRTAPDFDLANLDGDVVSLSQFRGQVVVLDFWATWCKPCLTSFPALHALVEPLRDQGVVLIAVSLDRSEDVAREYLAEQGYGTELALWGSLDEARAVQTLYGVIGIPKTFVVDREGYIRYAGHPERLREEDLEPWL